MDEHERTNMIADQAGEAGAEARKAGKTADANPYETHGYMSAHRRYMATAWYVGWKYAEPLDPAAAKEKGE